jgi:glycosyltransferase involved in cell wall biosynthesis
MKKRLLILSPRFPYPVIGGDRLRLFHICKGLSHSFELSLLTLCETKEEICFPLSDALFSRVHRVYLPRWRSYLNAARAIPTALPLQVAYYRSPEFQAEVDRLLPQHDAVLAHLIRTGQYVEGRREPAILEMTDAISLNYQRVAELRDLDSWKKIVYGFERSRLLRYEQSALHKFRCVWLVSDVDRNFLARDPGKHVQVIPNGVDLLRLPFGTRNGDAIAFIGKMATLQNQDACFHFVREIFPKIRDRVKVKFRVIGNISNRVADKLLAYPDVEVTGRFDDVGEAVSGAFCAVCPMRAGAGIQNKILEYMALGLPCLTSRVGLEGINAIENEHLLVYDSVEEAAEKIIALHSDPSLRTKLARQGRALVEQFHDWNNLYPLFKASILDALNG